MDKSIRKNNKIPGSEKLTKPEEIAALSKYLKEIREIQDSKTELGDHNLSVPGRNTGRIPEIDSLGEGRDKITENLGGDVENLVEHSQKLSRDVNESGSEINGLGDYSEKLGENFGGDKKKLDETVISGANNQGGDIRGLEKEVAKILENNRGKKNLETDIVELLSNHGGDAKKLEKDLLQLLRNYGGDIKGLEKEVDILRLKELITRLENTKDLLGVKELIKKLLNSKETLIIKDLVRELERHLETLGGNHKKINTLSKERERLEDKRKLSKLESGKENLEGTKDSISLGDSKEVIENSKEPKGLSTRRDNLNTKDDNISLSESKSTLGVSDSLKNLSSTKEELNDTKENPKLGTEKETIVDHSSEDLDLENSVVNTPGISDTVNSLGDSKESLEVGEKISNLESSSIKLGTTESITNLSGNVEKLEDTKEPGSLSVDRINIEVPESIDALDQDKEKAPGNRGGDSEELETAIEKLDAGEELSELGSEKLKITDSGEIDLETEVIGLGTENNNIELESKKDSLEVSQDSLDLEKEIKYKLQDSSEPQSLESEKKTIQIESEVSLRDERLAISGESKDDTIVLGIDKDLTPENKSTDPEGLEAKKLELELSEQDINLSGEESRIASENLGGDIEELRTEKETISHEDNSELGTENIGLSGDIKEPGELETKRLDIESQDIETLPDTKVEGKENLGGDIEVLEDHVETISHEDNPELGVNKELLESGEFRDTNELETKRLDIETTSLEDLENTKLGIQENLGGDIENLSEVKLGGLENHGEPGDIETLPETKVEGKENLGDPGDIDNLSDTRLPGEENLGQPGDIETLSEIKIENEENQGGDIEDLSDTRLNQEENQGGDIENLSTTRLGGKENLGEPGDIEELSSVVLEGESSTTEKYLDNTNDSTVSDLNDYQDTIALGESASTDYVDNTEESNFDESLWGNLRPRLKKIIDETTSWAKSLLSWGTNKDYSKTEELGKLGETDPDGDARVNEINPYSYFNNSEEGKAGDPMPHTEDDKVVLGDSEVQRARDDSNYLDNSENSNLNSLSDFENTIVLGEDDHSEARINSDGNYVDNTGNSEFSEDSWKELKTTPKLGITDPNSEQGSNYDYFDNTKTSTETDLSTYLENFIEASYNTPRADQVNSPYSYYDNTEEGQAGDPMPYDSNLSLPSVDEGHSEYYDNNAEAGEGDSMPYESNLKTPEADGSGTRLDATNPYSYYDNTEEGHSGDPMPHSKDDRESVSEYGGEYSSRYIHYQNGEGGTSIVMIGDETLDELSAVLDKLGISTELNNKDDAKINEVYDLHDTGRSGNGRDRYSLNRIIADDMSDDEIFKTILEISKLSGSSEVMGKIASLASAYLNPDEGQTAYGRDWLKQNQDDLIRLQSYVKSLSEAGAISEYAHLISQINSGAIEEVGLDQKPRQGNDYNSRDYTVSGRTKSDSGSLWQITQEGSSDVKDVVKSVAGLNVRQDKPRAAGNDTSDITGLKKASVVPHYKLPDIQWGSFGMTGSVMSPNIKSGAMEALNINKYLRALAENTVGFIPTNVESPSAKAALSAARRMLLEETLNLLVIGRDELEKLAKTNRYRLPGGDYGGLLGGLMNGGVSGAVNAAASGLMNAACGIEPSTPKNRPEKYEETEGFEEANNRTGAKDNDKDYKARAKAALNSLVGKNAGDRTYNFNEKYIANAKGVETTLSDLTISAGESIKAVEELERALILSPYITTPYKFGTIGYGSYKTTSLDNNSYWEIVIEPYCSSDENTGNGGFSYLPSIEEINLINKEIHGIETAYSKWIPFTSFELQKSKLTTKTLALYDGEISYPVSMEFTNELRLTLVDDQYKSWRNYFQKCVDCSVYASEGHDESYYKDGPFSITKLSKADTVVAFYKNVTFRIIIYVMTPQYSTIKKFDLLAVIKEFSEEYSGEIEASSSDLSIGFSIVGENPCNGGPSLKLSSIDEEANKKLEEAMKAKYEKKEKKAKKGDAAPSA